MGNSLSSKKFGSTLLSIGLYSPTFAILGSWIGSAICLGPGTIIGAVVGGAGGVCLAIVIAASDSGGWTMGSSSTCIHKDTPGVLASCFENNPSSNTSTSTYQQTPYLANCQFCTECGKGCECCDHTGTYVHT
jgi:hypothetical protein